ncbi:MAG: PEP/pyruvate-binding domain-containing protein [Candidatus Binatia bacterium]
MRPTLRVLLTISSALTLAAPAGAFRAPELSAAQQKTLRDNFALCVGKLKGPFTENTCLCPGDRKVPVRNASGQFGVCKGAQFCAAFRAPWAEALTPYGMYIANIFSRDLYLWNTFPDHNDLVRGYILEQYFVDTHPNHKLAQLRAFGGLSGAEWETPATPLFFERYVASPEFTDGRDFLLAFELQRRFLVRGDIGQINKVRAIAVRLQGMDPKFKPLRDAVHNQLSAGLLVPLTAYRDKQPAGARRDQVDLLIDEVRKLTAVDESTLKSQIAALEDAKVRDELAALVPQAGSEPVAALTAVGQLMATARQAVAARAVTPADARRLIDINITAAADVQRRGSALLESGTGLSLAQNLQLLRALTDATYGAGLLVARERAAALGALDALLADPSPSRAEFIDRLHEAERVVEWAQANVTLAFAEVMPAWTLVLPDTAGIRDDVLRGSPLLLFAQVARRLDDAALGARRAQHEFFGAAVDADVRALNPGLAIGRLRVAPKHGAYARDEIVALPETPADLDPAAGILTQGEGNMLSHVQLLARALGIPNVVLGPSAYARLKPHDGQQVFFIVTPGGRVIIKEAAAMSATDRDVYAEYTRNEKRNDDGSLAGGAPRLHIDRDKVDLSQVLPIDLDDVRRSDSGKFCGPKAAYLGELRHEFPQHVARGLVVPFGAYYQHYQRAGVAVPERLRGKNLATPGEPLPAFVERTYTHFFEVLTPSKPGEKALTDWITPRLEIIRYSIAQAPLAPELTAAIRAGLEREGLMTGPDQTVGCFVRSDTNVEDLDNFNGAGLNLTVFNRKSLDDITRGLKEVWASPFTFRSFSWRQTLIDDPLWVLASVVILEAVPSEKSGVLVTADPISGTPGGMLVATSEGVGGAVDGTSAETLLWTPERVELVTLFKSPWRNQLQPGGGSAIVPSSGTDEVLTPAEVEQIVGAGQKITETFTPVQDPAGKPRPWDIEFGFAAGKLWLFQCRPFLGNDQLKNVPALAPLESATSAKANDTLSLEEIIR